MTDKQDLAPEKVRIKDSYRERIFAESQQLGKSYLETLYFIIDCYFAFRKGAFPTQQVAFTPINTEDNKLTSWSSTQITEEEEEDSDGETFSLDFDL
ncbi:hypothetical protein CDG77_22600 [Nostoc sp. 'Peltigera membranacea cyanobiont' 213]|uniref:hypothetical protein n=1 Tax=Nostoc sp. 'Peltigera membranacea cyanobiont' 213 TaxID=2014530 RepID=UPI000B95492D|nr:hypothetical protein [Nostoc sp. 'Peltigera membranacea cyanobiont' 213]OYD88652.1 hypothetical protein CDG77_22600 [Nostoc sp. 'Peltigera membranacea cyanobiont' 213]